MSSKTSSSQLAKNIKLYVKKRDMTINALADFAGVSRSQLYDVLSGAKSPTVHWLEKIANALGVKTHDLLK